MYDFVLVSTMRSGSHMLASALDSHPEIQCRGEGEDKGNKMPFGHGVKRVKGYMAKACALFKLNDWGGKIVCLTRDPEQVALSHYMAMHGYNGFMTFDACGGRYPSTDVWRETIPEWAERQSELREWAAARDSFVIDYADLTHGADVRDIDAPELLDYLGVERMVLHPMTHKPERA